MLSIAVLVVQVYQIAVGILLFEMVAVILPIVLKASETFDKQGLPCGPCHPSALHWHARHCVH